MTTLAFQLDLPMWLIGLLVALFVIISFMLTLIILIQKPQGGGLSEAFGSSSGSGHTAFGAKTGDALTTATIGIFVVFILAAIFLNYAVRPPEGQVAGETTAGTDAPATTPQQSSIPVPTQAPAPGQPGSIENAITLEQGPDGTLRPASSGSTPVQPQTQPATTPAGEQPAQPGSTPPEASSPASPDKPQ